MSEKVQQIRSFIFENFLFDAEDGDLKMMIPFLIKELLIPQASLNWSIGWKKPTISKLKMRNSFRKTWIASIISLVLSLRKQHKCVKLWLPGEAPA